MRDVIMIFRCVIGYCRVERNKLLFTPNEVVTRTSMLNGSKRD